WEGTRNRDPSGEEVVTDEDRSEDRNCWHRELDSVGVGGAERLGKTPRPAQDLHLQGRVPLPLLTLHGKPPNLRKRVSPSPHSLYGSLRACPEISSEPRIKRPFHDTRAF
ncbi:unnamed protein product, partial [Discosporangium mesarthrocarpum]